MYICDVHKSSLRFHCQRFSNNSNPEFTDEEVSYHLSVLRVLPEILQHQGDTYFRQGVSVIMVSKIAVLSNVLRTPKYALRSI